jgi:pantetheine-phosphate adenylyltransferase
MMRKAVYAGSFDPLTKGHAWMIERGSEMFDKLILAVGVNFDKKSLFTIDERVEMLKGIAKKYPNVEVTSFVNKFLVDYARSVGAKYIIRGIRNVEDYEYEKGMQEVNFKIDADVRTIFLMPPLGISNISSSLVKGLIGSDGWEKVVEDYVPSNVQSVLLKKFGKKR